MFGRLFQFTLISILVMYLASFASFMVPQLNAVFFIVFSAAVLALTLYKFEYGLLLMLAEIFVGSKGYLFWVDVGDARISLRMALFGIVVAVWVVKIVFSSQWPVFSKFSIAQLFKRYFRITVSPYHLIFLAIAWALFNGWLRGNSFSNIYHDANAWVYFLLVPIFVTMNHELRTTNLLQVFLGAVSAMVVKSFVLLYLFSHEFIFPLEHVYPWLRKFLLGEITIPEGGWPRIFFQSQIFVLIGFFVVLMFLILRARSAELGISSRTTRLGSPSVAAGLNGSAALSAPGAEPSPRSLRRFVLRGNPSLLLLAAASLSVIIMSFSRSFWVGLLVGLIALGWWVWSQQYAAARFCDLFKWSVGIVFLSAMLIVVVLYFPIPKPLSIDFLSSFKNRLTDLTEAAVRSRWDLLPPLWDKIEERPLLGSGFGTTVTYHSSDPRAVELSVNGMFTTFSFEWGYLDLWLKLGLFGLIAYLGFLVSILRTAWLKISYSSLSFYHPIIFSCSLGLLVLMAVHFFSPYLNHPLGIVYVVLLYTLLCKTDINSLPSGDHL